MTEMRVFQCSQTAGRETDETILPKFVDLLLLPTHHSTDPRHLTVTVQRSELFLLTM